MEIPMLLDVTKVKASSGVHHKNSHSDEKNTETDFSTILLNAEKLLQEESLANVIPENISIELPVLLETDMEMVEELMDQFITILNQFPDEEKDEEYTHYLQSIMNLISSNATITAKLDVTFQDMDKKLDAPILKQLLQYFKKVMDNTEDSNVKKVLTEELPKLEKLIQIIESKLFASSPSLKEERAIMPFIATQVVKEAASPIPLSTFQMEQFQTPKQSIIHVTLNTTSDSVAREQLISRIEQLLLKSNVQNINGNKQFTIRLHPDHLGTLHIKIQQTDAGLMARIIAHSKAAHHMLESGVGNLKNNLVASNVQVDKIEIVFQDQENRLLNQERQQKNDQHKEHNQFENKEHEDNETNDAQLFESILNEQLDSSMDR
ncbi:flagellar hook-length control protein FliK [Sutcliffiella cohnii]